MERPSFWLIDVSSFFFRSYYAVPSEMTSPAGLPVNALFGTLSLLLKLLKKNKPDYIAACFDSKAPSFRKQIFPDYKADRGETPLDLQAQIPKLKEMIRLLGIYSVEKEGLEADDLIGSLAAFGKKNRLRIVIASGDKDFAQLVDEHAVLFDSMKSKTYDIEGVKKKWGVPPRQMVDYLALAGDSSDNIPGVRGIGPKSAVRLLERYESLDTIYENLSDLKGALRQKLETGRESGFLSRELATLKQDVPPDCRLSDLRRPFYKTPALKSFLQELGFVSFLNSLFPEEGRDSLAESPSALQRTEKSRPGKAAKPPRPQDNSAPLQRSLPLDSFAEPAPDRKPPGAEKPLPQEKPQASPSDRESAVLAEESPKAKAPLDFADALPPYSSVWMQEALSAGGPEGGLYYLQKGKPPAFLSIEAARRLAPLLDRKWTRSRGYDLKKCYRKARFEKPIPEWDLMTAAHLLDSAPAASFHRIAAVHLGPEGPPSGPEEIFCAHKKLQEVLTEKMKAEEVFDLFQEIETPLSAVLHDMERTGVLTDAKEAESQSQALSRDLQSLEAEIYKHAGHEFKINSPKQLASLLFDKLNLPKGRKTKSGFSTDSATLMKIRGLHPLIPCLLEYRELFKLKTSYIDALLTLRDPETGRVHTVFHQTATSTGRLSSVRPNLQNIPIRGARGRQVRKCFKAPPGFCLISADYSQIELRLLAHIADDPRLCRAFEEDQDVHAATASEIFHIPLKEMNAEARAKAKAVNFGIAYGQGAFGLSEFLNISRQEAQEIIDRYFQKFQKVKDYIESAKEEAVQKGAVKTLFGRKRFFKPHDFQNPRRRAMSERAALNAPVQGSAADLVKKAMIALHNSMDIPILSQVHDELLFECPIDRAEEEAARVKALMESAVSLKVPLKVRTAVGKNWEEAHA